MYINDDPFTTYKLLWPEFERKGYTIVEQIENRSRYISFVSPDKKVWRFRASRIGYPFTSKVAKELSVHKEMSYAFVEKLGVSIPFTLHMSPGEVLSEEVADSLISKYGKVIVKPSNSSLSRGLTLDIGSKEALFSAIQYSRTYKQGAVIQEQVEGEEIRFIVIKGRVEAALLRRTARVVGDGTSTVPELIAAENEVRAQLVFPYIKYPQLTDKMVDAQFFASAKVLALGEVQELNKATMIKNGSSVYDVLPEVHSSYIATVEKLAETMDTQFIAIDFFFKDYTKEKQDRNYWFIEFNTSPVLKLCYGCRDGRMFDVMPRLVEVIDEWLHAPGVQA